MRAGGRGGAGGVKACERPPGGGRSTHHDDTVRLHCHVGQQRQQRQRVDQRCHDHRDKAPSCQGAAWSSVLVHSPALAGPLAHGCTPFQKHESPGVGTQRCGAAQPAPRTPHDAKEVFHGAPHAGLRRCFQHSLNACSRGGGARRQGAGEADGK